MDRRKFLKQTTAGLGALGLPVSAHSWAKNSRATKGAKELNAEVVILGGSVGGCAAALAAARNGLRVIMTEETDWIGGQLTQQSVPPDEHPWIEQFGATGAYRRYRNEVRAYYQRNYPLSYDASQNPNFNPGLCSVSKICHEPRAGLAVLEGMLNPYVSGGRLTILRKHKAVSASVSGDRVSSVRVRDLNGGQEIHLSAPYFVDATELGDLLPMTGTEYVTGAESQADTGEPHAASTTQPGNMQAISWCFVMSYHEGENHTIEKPATYDFWRNFTPKLIPPWPGRFLSLTSTQPITLKPRKNTFNPTVNGEPDGGLWTFRRLASLPNFKNGAYSGEVCLVNWPQIDYVLGNIIDVSSEELKKSLAGARQQSFSMFYWLQTEAPRPDGGAGWPGLRLRGDLTGTSDGLAKYPYIRESRRIKADFTVLEKHVGTEARMKETGLSEEEVRAESFPDSVGVGSYRIDLHPSTGGDNYIDISSLPFEIPLGSLIPQRMENLLPACKNLGVTHITNGCYRLHPVEWNIGESAGMLAVYCIQKKHPPRHVRNTAKLLGDFQQLLRNQEIEIRWPKLRPR